MPEKYNIPIHPVPPRLAPVGKYSTVEFREDCAGSCRECVKKKCIYGIFENAQEHMLFMTEPEYSYECNSCFRCVQECTRGIFSRVINPEYRTLGDDYWTPDIISRTWVQAHTGAIPVSGAGYRGPFSGEGFDSMWTDMSEIVRPTRDGIHGREYINTGIELSKRPHRLVFNPDMSLATDIPKSLEIPLPILFSTPDFGVKTQNILLSMAVAAQKTGTLMVIDAGDIKGELAPFVNHFIPRITGAPAADVTELIQTCPMIEMAFDPEMDTHVAALRKIKEDVIISAGVVLDDQSPEIAVSLAKMGIDTIHFYSGHNGKSRDSKRPRFLRDAIRNVHLALVDNALRNSVNLIFSGGIAMAEHVNKAIILGADGVAVDASLLVAMECRLCYNCKKGLPCPAKLQEVQPESGAGRIVNLMGAWRNQILEMLGAMGIREARRLRGEMGRLMLFDDLEKECFEPLFGEKKVFD